jgi:hypothetical protein
MTGVKEGSLAVRYRDIDFDINEVEPSKWRWVIYQKIASDPAIRDKTSYDPGQSSDSLPTGNRRQVSSE